MGTVNTMNGEVNIPLGVITREVITAYREGQCWALTQAISEQTEWPMVWIYAPARLNPTVWTKWRAKHWTKNWDGRSITEIYQKYQLPNWGFFHSIAKTPNNTFLDIGADAPSTYWKQKYAHLGPCALIEVPHHIMDSFSPNFKPVKPDIGTARFFVSAVLERAGYHDYI